MTLLISAVTAVGNLTLRPAGPPTMRGPPTKRATTLAFCTWSNVYNFKCVAREIRAIKQFRTAKVWKIDFWCIIHQFESNVSIKFVFIPLSPSGSNLSKCHVLTCLEK